MKKIIYTLLFVCLAHLVNAEEIKWQTNLIEAAQQSIKTKKPLMLFFTGSDWCGWCHRLQGEVFNTPEFLEWQNKNVIPVEVDFPRKKVLPAEIQEQNSQLQQLLPVPGYPTIWFVQPELKDGKLNLGQLGSQGYVAGGPSAWINGAQKFLPLPTAAIKTNIKKKKK